MTASMAIAFVPSKDYSLDRNFPRVEASFHGCGTALRDESAQARGSRRAVRKRVHEPIAGRILRRQRRATERRSDRGLSEATAISASRRSRRRIGRPRSLLAHEGSYRLGLAVAARGRAAHACVARGRARAREAAPPAPTVPSRARERPPSTLLIRRLLHGWRARGRLIRSIRIGELSGTEKTEMAERTCRHARGHVEGFGRQPARRSARARARRVAAAGLRRRPRRRARQALSRAVRSRRLYRIRKVAYGLEEFRRERAGARRTAHRRAQDGAVHHRLSRLLHRA